MAWQDAFWKIPLETPPSLRALSLAVHGQRGRKENYRLPDLWCMHLYRYEGSVRIDGVPFPIRPGYLSIVPPGARLEYEMHGLSRHVYAHFALPSAARAKTTVAAMTDTGQLFPEINAQFETVLRHFAAQPRRAEARFWDLLWDLSERYGHSTLAASERNHPALEGAIGWIELHLSTPISIPALVRAVSISHNQLLRLFHAKFGETIEAYIRHRRAERALHLLRHSTLPIKAVAGEVGFPEPQSFNKAMKRLYHKGPRQLRQDALSGMITFADSKNRSISRTFSAGCVERNAPA